MAAPTGGVWALRQGDFQPTNFVSTVAGVQAALDYCEAAGGGTVFVDSGCNILVTTTSVKVPNRCRLVGTGPVTSNPTFTASSATSVTAMVENKTQDGTQEYAVIERIQVYGNKASGAVVGAGILLKKVYVPSAINDCLVWSCSGNGIKLDGSTSGGIGEVVLHNNWVTSNNDDNVLFTGQTDAIYCYQLTCESAAAGKAQIRIDRAGASSAPKGHVFIGTQFEGTAAYDGIVLNECNSVTMIGISDDGSGAAKNLVKITGSVTGSDGAFAAAGHVIINARANLTTIIDDQTAGVTIGNAQGRFVRWYTSPVNSTSLDNSQIIGLAQQRDGGTVASASTISTGNGNFFTVSGATAIDNITNAARLKGQRVSFLTSSAVTIKHLSGGTGNIRCPGSRDYASEASQVCEFISDGTNWYQCGGVAPTAIVKIGNFADADTTPSVLGANIWITGNTGPTTITDFDDGVNGQVLYVVFTDANTTLADGTLKLNGGFTSTDNDTMAFVRRNSAWYELTRSAN